MAKEPIVLEVVEACLSGIEECLDTLKKHENDFLPGEVNCLSRLQCAHSLWRGLLANQSPDREENYRAQVNECFTVKQVLDLKNNVFYYDVLIKASTEISFSVQITKEIKYHVFMADLSQVLPSIIQYDRTMSEIADGATGLSIDKAWLRAIKRFNELYQHHYLEPLEIACE